MAVSRNSRRYIFTAVALLGAAPLVILPPLLLGRHGLVSGAPGARIVITSVSTLLGTVWALGFCVLAFRAEEEFVQQGSKFAWYWGGIAGVVISAPIYVFIQMGGLHWLDPAIPLAKPLSEAFALGYGLLLVSQLVCFAIALAWWKATKR